MQPHDEPPGLLAARLADGLTRLAAVARQLDWQAAETAGLTPTQAEILALLARRPDGVRLGEAAAHLQVRAATASDAVAALLRKDLLTRQVDARNRRAVRLLLTGRGRDHAARHVPGFAAVVAGLSPDEQRRALALVVKMIGDLLRRELIAPQRSCISCRHFRPHAHDDTARPHHCAFVNAAFGNASLRLDCGEHEPATPEEAAVNWRRFQAA